MATDAMASARAVLATLRESGAEPKLRLKALATLRNDVEDFAGVVRDAVAAEVRAASDTMSWSDIGDTLGVSRQRAMALAANAESPTTEGASQ